MARASGGAKKSAVIVKRSAANTVGLRDGWPGMSACRTARAATHDAPQAITANQTPAWARYSGVAASTAGVVGCPCGDARTHTCGPRVLHAMRPLEVTPPAPPG